MGGGYKFYSYEGRKGEESMEKTVSVQNESRVDQFDVEKAKRKKEALDGVKLERTRCILSKIWGSESKK